VQAEAKPGTELARQYMAKRKTVLQLYGLALFGVPIFFAACGAADFVAVYSLSVTHNLYLSVAIVWAAMYAAIFGANVPLAIQRYRVDEKFDLVRGDMKQRLVDSAKANAIAFMAGLAVVEVVFVTMNLPGEYTWVVAALGVSVVYGGFVYLVPALMPLFYHMAPLRNEALAARLRNLAQRANVQIADIYEWHISGRTRKANALVAGFGRSRKVVLTDTMVESFSEDEIEALMAHEFGHCVHNDVFKRVLLRTVLFLPVLWAVQGLILYELVPKSAGGWSNPAVVPTFWVLWLALSLYGNLVIAAVARRQEKRADRFAWEQIPSVAHFISAMNKATALNLVAFDKASEWKYTHPATPERIAAAEKFARERGQAMATVAATVSL
jgi:STE24 endopeptidase